MVLQASLVKQRALGRGGGGEGGFDSFQAPIRRVIYVSTVIYYYYTCGTRRPFHAATLQFPTHFSLLCAGHMRDRRSSKMQKFTSKRRRANFKHAKSWTYMHRPVAERADFVISRMFTVFCLHRPISIASQRQYSNIP